MKSKSFFSLLAGLAAGAALGVLYAPDKGKNTRAKVRKAAEDGLDELKETVDGPDDAEEPRASLRSLRETLREKGAEIKEGTRDLLLAQLDRLETALRGMDDADAESVSEAPDAQVEEQAQEEDPHE